MSEYVFNHLLTCVHLNIKN